MERAKRLREEEKKEKEEWNVSRVFIFIFFYRSTFIASAWSSNPDFIHYIYFPILILEKEPVFSLLNVQC